MSLSSQFLVWLHGARNFHHDFWLQTPIWLVWKVSFYMTLRSDNVPFSHHILCKSTNPSQTHKLRIRNFLCEKGTFFAVKTCAKVKPSQPKRGFHNHKLLFQTFLCVGVYMKLLSSKSNISCFTHFIHHFEALIIKHSRIIYLSTFFSQRPLP